MALADAYKQFLAAPNPASLASDASLVYVTTATVFKGTDKILEHFKTNRTKLQLEKQEPLTIIESRDAVVVESETSIKFLNSGGAYLPGLDDNFISDRIVHLPITHIVRFDVDGKILQIRQSWDQGALLKQCDVIGKTGRNWPIRDSTEQIRVITSATLQLPASVAPLNGHTQRSVSGQSMAHKTAGNRPDRNPHELFSHNPEDAHGIDSVISPKAAGTRPRQRSFTEIISDEPGSPSAGRERSKSPAKAIAPKMGASKKFQAQLAFDEDEGLNETDSPSKAIAPKAGAGKNFQTQRLFDETEHHEETESNENSPNRFYRPHPTKFNHFEFGDGSDPTDTVENPEDQTSKKTKHTSQWDFEDFVTPAKPKAKAFRAQEIRHWGLEAGDHESPVRKAAPAQVQGRKDAEAHFELVDDGPNSAEVHTTGPRGNLHNSKLGLYQNNLYDEEGKEPAPSKDQPLSAITNTNLKDRGRDFAAHWDMNDESPAQKPKQQTISDDRKKAVKMMDANWSAYDSSPVQKENRFDPLTRSKVKGDDRGIAIGGDGMGGGKNSNRNWFTGEDDEVEEKPAPRKKHGNVSTERTFNWDF